MIEDLQVLDSKCFYLPREELVVGKLVELVEKEAVEVLDCPETLDPTVEVLVLDGPEVESPVVELCP